MEENSVDLPEGCWESMMQLLEHPSDFNSLSLVCKQFLSITNRLLFTLTLSDPAVEALLPRLLQRFSHLKQIDLNGFPGAMNPILHQISLSGLNLESLNVSNRANFPVVGLRVLGSEMKNLKSLNCSRIRFFLDCHLSVIAESFPCLEELDISYPKQEHSVSNSKPISDSGIFLLAVKLKSLRKINLSGNSFITDKSLVFLSTNCLMLCQVVIHNCHFVTLNGIAKLIHDCRNLNSISVRGIVMPYIDVGSCDKSFVNWNGLFDICDCAISNEFLYGVAEARFPIKKLILSDCTNFSFNGISSLLKEYQSLEHLDLEAVHFLTDNDMAELSKLLHSVRYINLNFCNRLTNITFYSLARNCFALNAIEMAGTIIGVENIETDCTANHGIKSLNLAHNGLIDNGFLRSLASICPNLEVLNLTNCQGITEEGIVEVLKKCTEIWKLDVNRCKVMKDLFINLEFELPKLKVLSLKFAAIDDDALAMIGKRCRTLLQLDLAGCLSVTEKGVKEVVANCKEMREINLRWCSNVSGSIVPWMVFSRPSLKIIVPPGGVVTTSQTNIFLRHGCLV